MIFDCYLIQSEISVPNCHDPSFFIGRIGEEKWRLALLILKLVILKLASRSRSFGSVHSDKVGH
jgi:hypothetical protein